MDQNVLNEFTGNVREKYKNKIQEINIEHCTDSSGDYIKFNVLRIKKSQQGKGYGSLIMSAIVELADRENVRVILLVTNLWGSDVRQLREFVRKHGFIETEEKDWMIYRPKKKRKKL
jgi:GNAT superfamily N-acetyltransferase